MGLLRGALGKFLGRESKPLQMKEARSVPGVVSFLERRSGWVILSAILITLILAISMLLIPPAREASQDPVGEVFDLRDDLNDLFAPEVHITSFIAEAQSGDILTQESLWELYQHTHELLRVDEQGGLAPDGSPSQAYLREVVDFFINRPVVGVATIADAVQETLGADPSLGLSLENATDDQVKVAVDQVLSSPETRGFANSLSVNTGREARVVAGRDIVHWTAPALVFNVFSDNEALGGGSLEIGVGGGEVVRAKEGFNRNVERVLRGDQRNFRLWGVAIDVNLESQDEGAVAGTFIMFTVIAAVLIVGLSLRSYWATALTGTGLGVLMIWLAGVSALVGIKGGLVIEFIVPIAMISLGVDFAIHAVRRYQEERDSEAPRIALRLGLAGVLGALALAMLSDSVAFLANSFSGIEAVTHFGVAAAIAVASSFVVLGVVLPLAIMRIDELRPTDKDQSNGARILSVVGAVGVAVFSGVGVILLVALSKPAGAAVVA